MPLWSPSVPDLSPRTIHLDQRLRGSPIQRGATKYLGGERTNPPIGKALAFHSAQGGCGTVRIAHLAVVVTEIELCGVAMQMRFAHMMIRPHVSALEDREE